MNDEREEKKNILKILESIEIEKKRNEEKVEKGSGEKEKESSGGKKSKIGEVDIERKRGRKIEDDEIEMKIINGRIENLLKRGDKEMDLIDEKKVEILKIGKKRGEIEWIGDEREGCGEEIEEKLFRNDMRKSSIEEEGREEEKKMIKRIEKKIGGLNKKFKIGERRRLEKKIVKSMREKSIVLVWEKVGIDKGVKVDNENIIEWR